MPLEIPRVGHIVHAAESRPLLLAQHRFNFVRRPNVKFPFLAFAVGVLGAEESALGPRHVAQHIIERLARHPRVVGVPGGLKRLDVRRCQQRVVVQHLLEVRHEPPGIHRVACKPPAR